MAEGGHIDDEELGSWTASQAASLTARLAAAAARAADLAEKVAHIGAAVAHELGLPAVSAVVLDETMRTLEARFVALHLTDADQRSWWIAGHRGLPEDLSAEVTQIPFAALALPRRAAATRKTQIVSGAEELAQAPPPIREALARMGCQTLVSLPLHARNQLLGVLTFGLADERVFTVGERATLDSCGHVFSFALANATRFEEERRLRALFEAVGKASLAIASELELVPSLQSIVDEARRIADAEHAALGIFVAEDQPFAPWVFSGVAPEQARRIGAQPRPVGTLGELVTTGRTIRVADVRQHPAFRGFPPEHPEIHSFLGVAIRYEGGCIGNLYLGNKRGGVGFSMEDQQAIELLAAHAGAVMHQRRLRQQLEAERARFKAIVESAPHGVVFVEAHSGAVIANRRAFELMGDRLLPGGVHGGEVLTPEGGPIARDQWPLARARRGEMVLPQEYRFRHPSGREVPVLVSAAPVGEPQPQGTVVLFEDISVLKELQRLREEWAAIVTHEMRQPLTVLRTSLDLLHALLPAPDDERLQRVVERTRKAAQSLSRLIDDLAQVSRIESRHLELKPQRVHLEVLAGVVVEGVQLEHPGREIVLRVAEPVPAVEADPIRIEQVVSNLLGNALKYAAPGTPVDVEVRAAAGEVHLSVTNRGPGLTPEEVAKLFQRYYRTPQARAGQTRGLGLGLYVAKGLVEAHGGRIWAESRVGETTTFGFALRALPDG